MVIMNMIVNTSDLVGFEAETEKTKKAARKAALSKLLATWESKQSNRAKKVGGFGLLAVSLAACNSDDSTDLSVGGVTYTNAQAVYDAGRTAGVNSVDITSDNTAVMMTQTAYDTAIANANAAGVASVDITTDNAAAVNTAVAGSTSFTTLADFVAAYDALVAPTTAALTTGNDTPALSSSSDTITADATTFTAGDVIVDSSTTDSDNLTITATGDLTATPTIANVENVNFNINAALATGNNEFSVAVTNISGATVNFDVTADSSLVTNLAITNAGTNTYSASADFTTIALGAVADADIVLNTAAATTITTTGTADDLTVNGGANNVTITSTEATEDLVVTGANVDINSGSTANAIDIAGTVNITATGTLSADMDTAAGNITVNATSTIAELEADASAGALSVTGGADVTMGAGTAIPGTSLTVTAGQELVSTTALTAGAISATATNNATVIDAATTGNVTVTAGSSETGGALTENTVTVAASTGTVTVTGPDQMVVDASAATTVVLDNTGAATGDDIDVDAAAATQLTITSVGDVNFTAAAAAVTQADITLALPSTLNFTGSSNATLNLTATADVATATPIALTLGGAGVLDQVNINNGGFNVTVQADSLGNITTETYTTTGAGTTVLEINADAGNADLSNVASDIIIALGTDVDTRTITARDTGAKFRLDDDQGGTITFAAETAANTTNTIEFDTVSTNAAATIAAMTLTDYRDVTLDAGDGTITFSGALTGDQLANVIITGDNAVSFGTTSIANAAGTPTPVTVNASAMTAGGLTIDLNGAAGGVETVQGSAVADDFDATAVASSGTAYTINGNAGNDTLTVSTSATSSFDGGAGNDIVEMDGAATLTYAGGAGIDTLNIANTVNLAASSLSLTSVEQIEFEEGGNDATDDATIAASFISGTGYIFDDDAGSNLTEVVISMNQPTVDLSNIAFTSDFVDGTDYIRADASSLGLAASITGSSQGDQIGGSAVADTLLSGGAGVDTIDGNGGQDTITTGAGADIVVLDDGTTLSAQLASRDVITDFTAGTGGDKIDFNGATDNVTQLDGTAAPGANNSIVTHGTSGNLTTTDAGSIYNITVEDVATLSEDGASVLEALVTGAGDGTVTAHTAADVVLFAVSTTGGDTGIYLGASGVGNTAMIASEITLIATLQGVDNANLIVANFM